MNRRLEAGRMLTDKMLVDYLINIGGWSKADAEQAASLLAAKIKKYRRY